MYPATPLKPKWRIIAANIGDNLRFKVRRSAGATKARVGSHGGWTVQERVEYVNRVFEDYLAYGGLSHEDVRGKTILEIGPGDNLGVALRFIAAGASKVVCLDKFFAERDVEGERGVYQALRAQCSQEERERFDAAIRLENGIAANPDRLHYMYGAGVEETNPKLGHSGFDLILSRAVLMEVHDPDRAFFMLDQFLRPGGRMIHKIAPLRDYGLFSANGYHLLEFLTVPDFLYRRMTRDSGKPNRQLAGYHQRKMRELRYDAEFQIARILGMNGADFPPGTTQLPRDSAEVQDALGLIESIRPRLLDRFRCLDVRELMIEDFFLVAWKP